MPNNHAVKWKRNNFDSEKFHEDKATKGVLHRVKGKRRCPNCGGFLCVCQSVLQDFGVEVSLKIKEPSLNQKMANCPHNCLNHTIKCLECYKYNQFETKVLI